MSDIFIKPDPELIPICIMPFFYYIFDYATTLHYAPCNASDGGFLVAVVLPKGTNEVLEHPHTGGEDALLAAKNKWLIGHPEGGLPEGSYIGLTGENLDITES